MYAEVSLLKSFAQTPDSHYDDVFEQLSNAASLAFDNEAEVEDGFFNAAIEVTEDEDGLREKVIRTNGEFLLQLPPFIPGSLSTVEAEEGKTFPDYRVSDSDIGRQYLIFEKVEQEFPPYSNTQNLPVLSWTSTPFDLTITARWGWEAIPADITQAVIEHALVTWRNRTDPAFARISDVNGKADKETPLFDAVVKKYRAKFSQKVLF